MYEIFISYRRKDNGPYAGRLCDLLRLYLGNDKVFMDEDSIPYGEQFLSVIMERLAACAVFLAVIGPQWSRTTKAHAGASFNQKILFGLRFWLRSIVEFESFRFWLPVQACHRTGLYPHPLRIWRQ
jgi:hypothetical protein